MTAYVKVGNEWLEVGSQEYVDYLEQGIAQLYHYPPGAPSTPWSIRWRECSPCA